MNDKALDVLLAAVARVAGSAPDRSAVTADTSLRSLGVSSLALHELVGALEAERGVVFDDADVDAAHFRTVGSTVALLGKYDAR